jgi:hypothetical protein
MRGRIRSGLAAGVLLTALGAGIVGCASSGESWDEIRQRLIAGGMTPDQVDCLEDGLNERGLSLTDYDSPNEGNQAAITEVFIRCSMGETPLPPTP